MDGKSGQDPANLPLIARLSEAESGRVMEVFGSQPSAQVYTANYLSTGEFYYLEVFDSTLTSSSGLSAAGD